MNTAFYIIPEKGSKEPQHLLAEAGSYGISFAWYTKSPLQLSGIIVYDFSNKQLPGDLAAEFKKIFHSNSIFNDPYASVNICYDFKESLLVPEEYYKHATAQSMMHLVYATDHESTVNTEAVKSHEAVNLYAVHNKVRTVMVDQFPGAYIHHTSSLLLQQPMPERKTLDCIFFHNSIKVILYSDTALMLVKQFNYKTPADAAFHLLNVCKQYEFSPAETILKLSGLIDEKSRLYETLHGYFPEINYTLPVESMELYDRIKTYPGHFFSHITRLISCVS